MSLAATAMTINRGMVGTVTRHMRNGTLLWLIMIPDPAVVTSNPKYLENQDGTGLCPSEEHVKAPRRKYCPRRKITDVEQIGADIKRNDVEGLHMETDAMVDNSITRSSRVNERLTTPFHYSSVHFDSPELPCAGILLSSTLRRRFLEFLMADSDFTFALGLPGRLVRCSNSHMLVNFLKALDEVGHPYLVKLLFSLIARVLFSFV